jgi:hypothetical protein
VSLAAKPSPSLSKAFIFLRRLSAIRDLLLSYLKEKHIRAKLCLKSATVNRKFVKCRKLLSVKMPWEEHRLLNDFSIEAGLKFC